MPRKTCNISESYYHDNVVVYAVEIFLRHNERVIINTYRIDYRFNYTGLRAQKKIIAGVQYAERESYYLVLNCTVVYDSCEKKSRKYQV